VVVAVVCAELAMVSSALSQSWTSTNFYNNYTSLAATSDGGQIAVASLFSGMVTSTNAGASWTLLGTPDLGDSAALACSAGGESLVAAFHSGGIYNSPDWGITWQQTGAQTNAWNCLALSADGATVLAGTAPGVVWKSADGGSTWSALNTPDAFWQSVASSTNGSNLVAAGYNCLYRSTNAGATWTILNPVLSTNAVISNFFGLSASLIIADLVTHKVISNSVVASAASGTNLSVGAPVILLTNILGLDVTNFPGADITILSNLLGDGALGLTNVTGSNLLNVILWTNQVTANTGLGQSVLNGSAGTVSAGTNAFALTSGGLIPLGTNALPAGVALTSTSLPNSASASSYAVSLSYPAGLAFTNRFEVVPITTLTAVLLTNLFDNVTVVATNKTKTEKSKSEKAEKSRVLTTQFVVSGSLVVSNAVTVDVVVTNVPQYWSAVASSADGLGLAAVVNGGLIYTSADGGVSWSPAPVPATNWLAVASSEDGGTLAAVAGGGLLYTSFDYGVTWTGTNVAAASNYWCSAAVSADGSEVVAATYGGRIYIRKAASSSPVTLSLSSSLDIGGVTTGAGTFPAGSVRRVRATPADGWFFVGWTTNGTVVTTNAIMVSTNPPVVTTNPIYTFPLAANTTLVANFVTNATINLSVLPPGAGTLSGAGIFPAGSLQTVSATPGIGWNLSNWTEDDVVVSTNADYTFEVTNDCSLTANFVTNFLTVDVSAVPAANGTVLGGGSFQAGTVQTLQAIPSASGWGLSNWTENGVVVSTNSAFTFTLLSNCTVVANFARYPFVPVIASYAGLFYDLTNGVAMESSGAVTLNTTAAGKFTGTLRLAAEHYSLSGAFDTNGFALVKVGTSANPMSVALQVDLAPGSDRLDGSVSSAAWTATLECELAYSGKTGAPHQGSYTLIFPGPSASDGYGCATVTVSPAGIVTLAGSLADGTKLAPSSVLCLNGQSPLYLPLYSGAGSLLSWLTFAPAASNAVKGSLSWIKPTLPASSSATKACPGPFAVNSALIGSSYSPPAAGAGPLNLTNAEVVLCASNLSPAFTNVVTFNGGRAVSSNKLVSITFKPASGSFTGSLAQAKAAKGSKPLTFSGVVLQNQNLGCGYFLDGPTNGQVLLGNPPAQPASE
jgi:photosystem II stability/assembly factor-like uncharacterized protein